MHVQSAFVDVLIACRQQVRSPKAKNYLLDLLPHILISVFVATEFPPAYSLSKVIVTNRPLQKQALISRVTTVLWLSHLFINCDVKEWFVRNCGLGEVEDHPSYVFNFLLLAGHSIKVNLREIAAIFYWQFLFSATTSYFQDCSTTCAAHFSTATTDFFFATTTSRYNTFNLFEI